MTKSILPVKAQLLDPDEIEAWAAGKIPRRLLAIPFGGPLPHPISAKGADLDGDWFSERTDIFGPYRELRESRERLVDWHHSLAPVGGRGGDPGYKMNGVIIGKAVLDEEPDEDGWWVNLWLKAGERRVSLVRALARAGAQLFGSSQAIPKGIKADDETGEVLVWPMVLQTLTTAPQNTLSVVRPMKAMLDEADYADISVSPSMKAMLSELDQLRTDLLPTSIAGEDVARDERVPLIDAAFVETLDNLRR